MSLDVMNLLLVLLAALGGGWVARRVGYPSILGELGAGILLGPPLLGLLQPDDALAVIGKLGVVLLMLYIGLHLDPGSLGKASRPGGLAALGGFLVPAGLGFALMMLVDGDPIAATFVATAMGVTSLATKSRILVDLGILHTRIAHVLMAGALFSDVAALIVFAALLGFAATGGLALSGIAASAGSAALFLAGAWLVGTRVFPAAGRRLADRRIEPSVLFLGVVSVGLAFAAAADAAGLHAILGAFLAGLFIRDNVLSRDRLADVESRARSISVGALAPVFFVTAGFDVSFDVFTTSPGLLLAVVILATIGKIFGTALFYLPTGYGFREGVAVGAGMNGRGAVEIIVAELALAAGLIDGQVFSILVFMAIFTTATVPILLTRAIDVLRRRGELVADERDGVLIIGAGPIARRLALQLAEASPVTLVDTNAEHCEAAHRVGLSAIKADGMDQDVLAQVGADSASVFVAATANSEVNLLATRVAARRFEIPALHVAVTPAAAKSLKPLVEELGAEWLFGRPVNLTEWDLEADQGLVEDLVFTTDDSPETPAEGPADASWRSVATLPLTVHTPAGVSLFTQKSDLGSGATVAGLGRTQRDPMPEALGLG